jgi:uncharacterized protein YndB with AHSA1/START domain
LIRIQESIEIACSPETVWALVADPLNDPRWCDKVESAEAAADNRWTVIHKPSAATRDGVVGRAA